MSVEAVERGQAAALGFASRAEAFEEENVPFVGSSVGLAWADSQSWMHRRVDSYAFHNSESFHCSASIDFTVPENAPVVACPGGQNYSIVPLMLTRKSELSVHFDLRDSSGRSMCRLRGEEAARISGEILISFAGEALGEDVRRRGTGPGSLAQRLLDIASSTQDGWSESDWTALRAGNWGLFPKEQERVFADISPFRDAVNYLSCSSLLCVLVPGRAGDSCIVKISFDTRDDWNTRQGVEAVPPKLGCKDWGVGFQVPAGDPRVYHFEVSAPDGIDIRMVTPKPPVPHTPQVMDECAHLVVQDHPPEQPLIMWVTLRAAQSGWLGEALAAGLLVTSLMFAVFGFSAAIEARDETPKGQPVTDHIFLAGTVLLALAAALIALLARNEEHQLRAQMLRYLRWTLGVQVVLTGVAVMVLVVSHDVETVKWSFLGLGVLAFLGCVPEALAWYGSRHSGS